MLKIRLARHGAKKRPFYHIVIAEATSPRDGRFIEKIGFYNPMVPKDSDRRLKIEKERAEYWLSVGAKPTDRVCRFFEALSIGGIKRPMPVQTKKSEASEKTKQLLADKEEKRKNAAEAAAEAPAQPADAPVTEESAPEEKTEA